MNITSITTTRTAVLVAGLFLLSACATGPKAPEAPLDSRVKLTALQSDSQLATRAPVELQAAEAAVKAAEIPRSDAAYSAHLVLLADQKVEIARARAQARQYQDQRQALAAESERARLDARTLEVDRARADAASARGEVAASQAARMDLQRQIAELNARETDRGLVVTLGDVLFATGKSNLMGGAGANLDKLAAFLGEYPDRTVLIEGHTDSVGSAESNYLLSQRRADSVRSYLVNRGVQANRLTTAGLGEGSPVASNDTATGRQQNRRVEVIISNTANRSNAN